MENRATSARVARAARLHALVGELGDWWSGPGPLFRQLARAVAAAIERGALEPGARLPAERVLASSLSISRGTAVAAYELLVSDGLVERQPGSGTFVIGAGSLGLPPGREGSALVARLVDRSAGDSSDVIDLSISVLRHPVGLPRLEVSTHDLLTVRPDTGLSPWGLEELRISMAALVTSWGLPTAPAEVVITTGAQQGISAAAACWVRPGDAVVVEDPTYPGAVAAFGAAGARLVGIPVDAAGARPDALADAIARTHPTLVYLQPTLHSPTGAVLSDRRRREIAELVHDARVPLVEDHALAGLCWDAAPPPIARHRPEHPVAVVGSLSKRYWGGLRVGFVRAPEPVALRFARVKATQDLGSSAVSQLLAQRILAAPTGEAFVVRRNRELRRRYEHLSGALAAALGDWTWAEPAGGLSIWVRLPHPVAERLAQAALRSGVAVATAAALSPDATDQHHIRLSFAAPEQELTEGVSRLARAWSTVT